MRTRYAVIATHSNKALCFSGEVIVQDNPLAPGQKTTTYHARGPGLGCSKNFYTPYGAIQSLLTGSWDGESQKLIIQELTDPQTDIHGRRLYSIRRTHHVRFHGPNGELDGGIQTREISQVWAESGEGAADFAAAESGLPRRELWPKVISITDNGTNPC